LLRGFGLALVRLWFRFRVSGRDRLPAEGPFLVASNHCSFIDPVILQAACPRQLTWLMTDTIFNVGWARWFFRMMRCIPVRERDGSALREGLAALARGEAVAIFPEGGLSPDGTLQRGHAGVGTLAIRSGVPVIPAFLSGTRRAFLRGCVVPRPGPVEVELGEPLRFDGGGGSRDESRAAAAAVMDALARLQEARGGR
jgi:1-acyl-sn-glycerol-3-phosphate acyltransferase